MNRNFPLNVKYDCFLISSSDFILHTAPSEATKTRKQTLMCKIGGCFPIILIKDDYIHMICKPRTSYRVSSPNEQEEETFFIVADFIQECERKDLTWCVSLPSGWSGTNLKTLFSALGSCCSNRFLLTPVSACGHGHEFMPVFHKSPMAISTRVHHACRDTLAKDEMTYWNDVQRNNARWSDWKYHPVLILLWKVNR